MESGKQSASGREERVVVAFLFIVIGSIVMVVFSPLRPVLAWEVDYLGRIGLIFLLLISVGLFRKSARFSQDLPISIGLLILAIAVSLDWVFGRYLMDSLGINGSTPVSFALLKLNEGFIVVSVVILFTRISGGRLGSIYIQKGNLKLGLMIGLIAFIICVAGSIPMAGLMFNSGDLPLTKILSWIPWVLISVLANAAQEEILFRGLFLRKLQPFLGGLLSNLLIVFVFTLLHKGVTYSSNEYIFLAILIPLGLAWGYIMQKTDSVWGSILFHAGTDIPIFLAIFSGMS
ncbi:MAG: CPBP family intramembrane glutamic endopeptidase [Flavisolibacter sp.]